MQLYLKNPPKFSIKSHPNYRVLKVSERQGNAGFVLPNAELLVPDKKQIRDLAEIIQIYQKLKPRREEASVGGSFPTHRYKQFRLI